ncbi:sensor histidine kinase [Saccharothrix algeriensis]|uniref:histidine kinase n=3 Tax=Saccharothrix algeriensis TaxID=173560 RepID=A0ABS2S0N6_9PSEU|nr:HAMP domain-containing sensor histidine kinase [Saccharothrix algeriensis]MBM7809780.1 signal transduction histidine kinase [Saccharothrix algeriensis]
MTAIATAVLAAPVLAVAALAAVFLREQAMRPDAAPYRYAIICAGTSADSTKPRVSLAGEPSPSTPLRDRHCVRDANRIETPSLRLGDLGPRKLLDPDDTVRVFAYHYSTVSVPDLSLWPFTDPYDIMHVQMVAFGETAGFHPLPAGESTRIEEFESVTAVSMEVQKAREQLAQAQRTLNHQVLSLSGGALVLIGLFGCVVWVAMGRVLRPVEAIRREMADITEHDLSRRVPVPRRLNEVAHLAATVNANLDRLEVAVEDNRRFVADASHELRSPLAALRAELEIATAHPGQADWPAVVDAALADTDRLQRLATDLLLLARLDHTTSAGAAGENVDLIALVRDHTTHRRSRHALTVGLPDRPTPMRGRRALLERLLGNLLDNAERHAATTITVRLSTVDGRTVLEVLDDGPGIPPEDRERIFDRFTRLDDARTRDTGGTGLGLPIARRIAAAHHGTLHATDRPDTAGARLVAAFPSGPHDTSRNTGTGAEHTTTDRGGR